MVGFLKSLGLHSGENGAAHQNALQQEDNLMIDASNTPSRTETLPTSNQTHIISNSLTSNDPVVFTGWARIFFLGKKKDLNETQIPCISSTHTLTRDSYIWVKIVDENQSLRILNLYTGEKSCDEPILQEPIKLYYFVAERVSSVMK